MKKLLSILLFLLSLNLSSEKKEVWLIDSSGTVLEKQIIETHWLQHSGDAPNPFIKFLRKKQINNRRVIATILAFPFPFGIVGLHRIYLNTKPYVPVTYIASLGGIFGILPLVDFFVLAFDKNFDQYENNSKVLMWVK